MEPLRNQGFLHFWNPSYANRTPTALKRLDERLHPIRALPFHRFGYVGVPIQRKGCGEVPHVLLEGFHIVTGAERRDRECVSQIVETVMFDPRAGQNLLENFPNCRLGQVAPVRMGKDQIRESAVVPDIPRVHSLPLLELFVFLENLHDERCRSDGAGLVIFQRPKLESTAFLARLENG